MEGSYTVSAFGQNRSADITMGSNAALNPDGSLTFPGVTIHSGDYVENGDMIVEVMDNPDMAVATKETGSVYCGYTTDSKFFLYFDASMMPTFFSYDP